MSVQDDRYGDDLLDLADFYALDAVTDSERGSIESRLAAADQKIRTAFAASVSIVRLTMAILAAGDAVAPPASLRDRVLAVTESAEPGGEPTSIAAHRARKGLGRRWEIGIVAAAAAAVLFVGGAFVGGQISGSGSDSTTVQAQVLSAADVQTTTGAVAGGGSATFAYSVDENAGLLLMKDINTPVAGTVYQMWLIPAAGNPRSVGLMTAEDVSGASTAAVVSGIDGFATLGITVEPTGGSPQPTTAPIAALEL